MVLGKRKLDVLAFFDVRSCKRRRSMSAVAAEAHLDTKINSALGIELTPEPVDDEAMSSTTAETKIASDGEGEGLSDDCKPSEPQSEAQVPSTPMHRHMPQPSRTSLLRDRRKKAGGIASVEFQGSGTGLEKVVTVENHRYKDLWYSSPGSWVTCDRCGKFYPQSGGMLRGGAGRSQFCHFEFACAPCLVDSGELVWGPYGNLQAPEVAPAPSVAAPSPSPAVAADSSCQDSESPSLSMETSPATATSISEPAASATESSAAAPLAGDDDVCKPSMDFLNDDDGGNFDLMMAFEAGNIWGTDVAGSTVLAS